MIFVPRITRILIHSTSVACARCLTTSSVLSTKAWRREKGLPEHRTADGPLIDLPDYTFLDGRPTPLLVKQKLRMLKQREFAKKIVQLNSEVDFAIRREQQKKEEEFDKRQRYVENKLKAKGDNLRRN